MTMAWFEENWLRVIMAITGVLTSGGVLKLAQLYYSNKNAALKLGLDTDIADNVAADLLSKHYATELEALRTQVTRQGEAHADRQRRADERYDAGMKAADERMKAADEREEHCQEQVSALRKAVAELTKEVLGLRAIIAQTGRSAIVLAANAPSLPIQESAERAATALGEADQRLRNLPHTETPE